MRGRQSTVALQTSPQFTPSDLQKHKSVGPLRISSEKSAKLARRLWTGWKERRQGRSGWIVSIETSQRILHKKTSASMEGIK